MDAQPAIREFRDLRGEVPNDRRVRETVHVVRSESEYERRSRAPRLVGCALVAARVAADEQTREERHEKGRADPHRHPPIVSRVASRFETPLPDQIPDLEVEGDLAPQLGPRGKRDLE